MSKQYLTVHTVDNAHPSPIFALATAPEQVLSASGSESIKIHSTTSPTSNDSPSPSSPAPQIPKAHRTGCHHLATGRGGPGKVLASAGFGDDVKIWAQRAGDGQWRQHGNGINPFRTGAGAGGAGGGGGGGGGRGGGGKVWAIALSSDEQFLACTSESGKVAVWDLVAGRPLHLYETSSSSDAQQGSFGMSVDISADGRFVASGHQSGAVYVFNNDTGRLVYSLTGLSKPIRAVKFSPLGTLLAAAGDAGIIAIYDVQNGEHVGNLSPSGGMGGGASSSGVTSSWITSLDWSHTGEYLLSGSFDGKVRVWSVEAGTCVATHTVGSGGGGGAVWAARWLPKLNPTRPGESFCAAGDGGSITFYREATGS